jgi:hypothetical protein
MGAVVCTVFINGRLATIERVRDGRFSAGEKSTAATVLFRSDPVPLDLLAGTRLLNGGFSYAFDLPVKRRAEVDG